VTGVSTGHGSRVVRDDTELQGGNREEDESEYGDEEEITPSSMPLR